MKNLQKLVVGLLAGALIAPAGAGTAELYWKCGSGWCPASQSVPLPVAPAPQWYYGNGVAGSYRMVYASPAYTAMAADTPVFSMRYVGSTPFAITAIAAKVYVTGVFTTNQLVGYYCQKEESYSVEDSGGTDISSGLWARMDSDGMPALTGLSVRVAAAGSTGLTAGTRTAAGNFFRDAIFSSTGQVAEAVYVGAALPFSETHPIVLNSGEGVVCYNTYALAGSGAIRVAWAMAGVTLKK